MPKNHNATKYSEIVLVETSYWKHGFPVARSNENHGVNQPVAGQPAGQTRFSGYRAGRWHSDVIGNAQIVDTWMKLQPAAARWGDQCPFTHSAAADA